MMVAAVCSKLQVWSEVLQTGAGFQMTFPVAAYTVNFFVVVVAKSDFVGCSIVQLHYFLLGQMVCQFVKECMR